MTIAIKVFLGGLIGATTIATGTTAYFLYSSKNPNKLKDNDDYQNHCFSLSQLTKDQTNSQFQLLACQANSKTNEVSFHLYQKKGEGITKDSFEEIKSVETEGTSSKVIFTLFGKETPEDKKELYLQKGWKPSNKLNNWTLKKTCQVNWKDGGDKNLTCQNENEKVDASISGWEKFRII